MIFLAKRPPEPYIIKGLHDGGNGYMQHLVTERKTGLQPESSLDDRMERLLVAGGRTLVIPHTTPQRYLSFRAALNL